MNACPRALGHLIRAWIVIAVVARTASAQIIPSCVKGEHVQFFMEEVEGQIWTCGSLCKSNSACCRVDMTTSPPKLIPIHFKWTEPRNPPKGSFGHFLALLALGGPMRQGFGSIWILVSGEGLHRFDPTTLKEVANVPIDGLGFFIADGAIWVLVPYTQGEKAAPAPAAPLYRINPESLEITAKLAWGDDLYPFTAAEGSLWGVRGKAGTLIRIDPVTGQSLAEIRVGPPHGHRRINFSGDGYTHIVAGEGALWIIESRDEGNLIKVDPKTNQVVATIPLGISPGGVAVGGGFVWVSAPRYVLTIDPRTNQILWYLILRTPSNPMLFPGKDGLPHRSWHRAGAASNPMLFPGKDGLIVSEDTGAWRFTQKVCFLKVPYSIGEPPTEKK